MLAVLAAVLFAGALLRLLLVLGWQPGLMGWPDAASYIDVSQSELFGNELRPAGYPIFLRALHELAPSLTLVVVLQHLLGLATAVLLYLAVARAGAPPALGLIPAAVVALGGDGIFLEHAPISESLFMFLVAAALYAALTAHVKKSLGWAAGCGLILALAACVRVVALPLLAVFAIWFTFALPLPLRRRLMLTGAAALGVLAVLVPYYVAEHSSVGETGLSRNGIWNVYGRVAPFADCSKFTPPRGTETLCETTPRPARPLTYQYTFNWYYSPAVRAFDNPHVAEPGQTRQVAAFAWAVILGQPLDYAEEVGAGMLRYVAPESFKGYGGGPSYHDLVHSEILFNRTFLREGRAVASKHYADARRYDVERGLIDVLRTWESGTRVQGPVFALLALLSLAGPFLTRGPGRAAAVLLSLAAWALLFTPVATVEFSARTAVPGLGALGAAAAVGAWGVAERARVSRWTRPPRRALARPEPHPAP